MKTRIRIRAWRAAPVLTMAVAGILLLVLGGSAVGQEIHEERVSFASGASAVTREGSINGHKIVDYLLNAEANSTLCVRLQTSNAANYFNVLPPGSETALFVGSVSGNEWTGALPSADEYTVRVYLMRSAAQRNESADYTLTFEISSSPSDRQGCLPRHETDPGAATDSTPSQDTNAS